MTASLSEVELSASLIVFSLGGDTLETGYGANCVAYAGRDTTVVVDPLVAPAHARLVAEALRRRGLPPVGWVIATHHHTDHVLGASVFMASGVTFVAHRAAAGRMAADHPALISARRAIPELRALFDPAVPCTPDVTFDAPYVIETGVQDVEVRPLGHGHSPGDSAVLFKSERTVCCGDVLHSRYHFNYEDADLQRLPEGLLALEGLADSGFSTFIPGHGASGDRGLLRAQRGYHEEVARIVANSPTAAAAHEAIRGQMPGWSLEPAIASAIRRRWPVR